MLLSKYSTRLSYVHVSQFHLGPATTLASLLLARAILQIFEATFKEISDPRDPPFPLQDGRSSTANFIKALYHSEARNNSYVW